MTVGIAVSGPRAGLAVFRALQAVEKVSRGAIGGFVSLVAIDAEGRLHAADTQRGSTRTLFTEGERTGVDPPPAIAEARLAALMASGPNRPQPLRQFTPGDPQAGLVTGHRMPNMPGVDGIPLAEAVLARLRDGAGPREAVEAELARNPEADAGLIAVDLAGRIHIGDSAYVQRRSDRGSLLADDPATGARCGVLHNAVFPHRALAALAAAAAFDAIAPVDRRDLEVVIPAGIRLERGPERALHLDADGAVSHMTVTEPSWLGPSRHGAPLPFDTPVRRAGILVGHVVTEPYCIVEHGRLVSLSGGDAAAIAVRAAAEGYNHSE